MKPAIGPDFILREIILMKSQFIKAKLSFMVLLGTFIGGSYFPIMSMYLKDFLHFSGKQAGFIMSMNIVAGVTAPLITIFIVDKLISKKMLYSICYGTASVLLLLLSLQKSFWGVLIVFALTMVFTAPAFGIMQALVFDSIKGKGSQDDYGKIRLWGTVGWMAAAWIFGFCWLGYFGIERLPDTFRFASVAALITALFIHVIPVQKTAVSDKNRKNTSIFSLTQLKEIFSSGKILFALGLYIIAGILNAVYFFGAAPYLKQIGLKASYIMPLLTISNIFEIIALFLLVRLQKKFGFKTLFIASCLIQAAVFSQLAFTQSIYFVISALMLQGLNFGIFLPLIVIYSDSMIDDGKRTMMHQLLTLLIWIANFIGNNFAGFLMDGVTVDGKVNYSVFWIAPVIGTILTVGYLLFMFAQRRHFKKPALEGVH